MYIINTSTVIYAIAYDCDYYVRDHTPDYVYRSVKNTICMPIVVIILNLP